MSISFIQDLNLLINGGMPSMTDSMCIVTHYSCVHEWSYLIRYYVDTGDIDGTLAQLPRNSVREIYVLQALKRHGKTKVRQKFFFFFYYFTSLIVTLAWLSLCCNEYTISYEKSVYKHFL